MVHVPGRGTGLLLQLRDEDGEGDEARLVIVIRPSDWSAGRRDNIYTVDPEKVSRRSRSPVPASAPRRSQPSAPLRRRNLPATPLGGRRRAVAVASSASQRCAARRKHKPAANSLLSKVKDHREKAARQRHLELFHVTRNSVLQKIAHQKPRSIPE